MSAKQLSERQIGKLIRAGKDFLVKTPEERALALYAARFEGVKVTSRKSDSGYRIFFL